MNELRKEKLGNLLNHNTFQPFPTPFQHDIPYHSYICLKLYECPSVSSNINLIHIFALIFHISSHSPFSIVVLYPRLLYCVILNIAVSYNITDTSQANIIKKKTLKLVKFYINLNYTEDAGAVHDRLSNIISYHYVCMFFQG